MRQLVNKSLSAIFRNICLICPLLIRVKLVNYLSKLNVGFLDYETDKKIKMFVSSSAAYMRLNSCRKEPNTIEWIEKFFNKGDVFYDIGANVGAYSLCACAKFNGNIKVIAFEPSFHTFPLLFNNIYLNGFQGSILPLNIALSNENKDAEFLYNSIYPGTAEHPGLEDTIKRGSLLYEQKLLVYALDYIVNILKIPHPNHIKIDVDGYEYSVLQGASELLGGRDLKSIQLEISIDSGSRSLITNFLEKKGFRVYKKNQHGKSSIFDFIFIKES